MSKYVDNRQAPARTKDDIASDYLDALIEKGVIDEQEKGFYTTDEGKQQILGLLIDKLYETEEHKGRQVSTLNAWYHWCKFVIKHFPGTTDDVWNKFVKDLFLDVERHQKTCVLASRGIGKSFCMNGLYTSFKAWLYSDTSFVLISNMKDQVQRNIRILKKVIESNELLLEKKNEGKDVTWARKSIEYNGGMILGSTVGRPIRGQHPNYIIMDDCLRDDNRYSDEEYKNFLFGQVLPAAQRESGRVILIGTPLYIGDLYHIVMNKKPNGEGEVVRDGGFSARNFYCDTYPIITDWGNKEVYLPELFDWEQLMDVRQTQGEQKFKREYMLVCTDESTSLFPDQLIKQAITYDFDYLYSAENEMQTFVIGVDVAVGGEASADASAFVVLEIISTDSGQKKIVRHITHEKGMSISSNTAVLADDTEVQIEQGQIETIATLSKRFNRAKAIVEKNNVGVALVQELEKMNVNVESFTTTKAKKENMIRYLVTEMKNDNIKIVDDPYDSIEEVENLKRELSNFGVRRSKRGKKERLEALSGHDDLVMSLAFANHAAENMMALPFAQLQ